MLVALLSGFEFGPSAQVFVMYIFIMFLTPHLLVFLWNFICFIEILFI